MAVNPTAVHTDEDRQEMDFRSVTPVRTVVDQVVPSVVATTADVVESIVASAWHVTEFGQSMGPLRTAPPGTSDAVQLAAPSDVERMRQVPPRLS
jgi:hypothetical protein